MAGFAWEKLGKWWLKWQKKTSKTMDFPAGKECWSNVGLMLDDLGSINMVFQHSPWFLAPFSMLSKSPHVTPLKMFTCWYFYNVGKPWFRKPPNHAHTTPTMPPFSTRCKASSSTETTTWRRWRHGDPVATWWNDGNLPSGMACIGQWMVHEWWMNGEWMVNEWLMNG